MPGKIIAEFRENLDFVEYDSDYQVDLQATILSLGHQKIKINPSQAQLLPLTESHT
jgi:hypothetical protein